MEGAGRVGHSLGGRGRKASQHSSKLEAREGREGGWDQRQAWEVWGCPLAPRSSGGTGLARTPGQG